jgi:hypothetical protein
MIFVISTDDKIGRTLLDEASAVAKSENKPLYVGGDPKGYKIEFGHHFIGFADTLEKARHFFTNTKKENKYKVEVASFDDEGRLHLTPLFNGSASCDNRSKVVANKASIKIASVAATGVCVIELNGFIQQWRLYNPEVKIFALVEESRRSEIEERWILDEMVDMQFVDVKEATSRYDRSLVKSHNAYWDDSSICLKLEAMRLCMAKYNKPTLVCDSDLILTSKLPKIEWEADVVLSSHQGPFFTPSFEPGQGYYNAGMVLVRTPRVANRWIELFQAGAGGFYEQGCLEQLSEEFVTDLFPATWNWGMWRSQESLGDTKRIPPVLHVHASGSKKPTIRNASTEALLSLACESLKFGEKLLSLNGKILFVHHPKAAGCSAMYHFHTVADRGGFQLFDSFLDGMRRDWTEEELKHLAVGQFHSQSGGRYIVHAHAHNISDAALQVFANEGWEIVGLNRPILERLVSSYTWSHAICRAGGAHPMGPEFDYSDSLADHLDKVREHAQHQFALTNAHRDLTTFYPATSKGIHDMIYNLTGVDVPVIKKQNESPSSDNPPPALDEVPKKMLRRISSSSMVKSWSGI